MTGARGVIIAGAAETDRLGRLPDPQRKALGVVFGLRAGEAPDRFFVGLAALSLLADPARRAADVEDDAQENRGGGISPHKETA